MHIYIQTRVHIGMQFTSIHVSSDNGVVSCACM